MAFARYSALRNLMVRATARLPVRHLARSNLLIICYHGFAQDDEAEFHPGMFMRPSTFEKRMDFLARNAWPVFSLNQALQLLADGDLPPGSIVISADDGWCGTIRIAEKTLRPRSFPMTNYITTHYLNKSLPVSNMMLAYLIWKGKDTLLRKQTLNLGGQRFKMDSGGTQTLHKSLAVASEALNAAGRDQLNAALACELELGYPAKLFRLMDNNELCRAASAGVDIQLHGDRHLGGRMLSDEALFKREITVNRDKLLNFATSPLEHFCYPSGAWNPRQEVWLQEMGIRSAVTCTPGLNTVSTNPFRLLRFLDREDIGQQRFMLEISGIRNLLRAHR